MGRAEAPRRRRHRGRGGAREINAALPRWAKRFLKLRAVGEELCGDPFALLGAADLFALCALIPVKEQVRQGASWKDQVLGELQELNREWAEQELAALDQLATPLLLDFSQDAAFAYAVGRSARDGTRPRYAAAERYLLRAVALADEAEEWDCLTRAYLALAVMYSNRGAFPRAREYFALARRTARDHRLVELQGWIAHDMLVMATETEDPDGSVYAAAALEAYGPTHPRLTVLAHDTACYYLSQGDFAKALAILEAVVPRIEAYGDPVLAISNVARAAGALGDLARYERAAREVRGRLRTCDQRFSAMSALNMAHGASCLGRWEEASSCARTAMAIARRRRESKNLITAEAVLDLVKHGLVFESRRGLQPTPTDDVGFTETLVRSLEAAPA
jgi:tetratricopeptide (TPR) repeat protein